MSCVGGLDACPGALTGASYQTFMILINTLMNSKCALNSRPLFGENYQFNDDESFDYIVIGGGASGSVVASRLAENKTLKVLLLERGDYPSSTTEVPGFFPVLTRTAEDYAFVCEPSNACYFSNDKRCIFSAGKMLGGSSCINGMLYVRGNERDYDGEWNCDKDWGWDYKSVMEGFNRAENIQVDDLKNCSKYGKEGYMTLTKPKIDDYLRNMLYSAALDLGNKVHTDSENMGYYETVMNIEDGKRCHAAKSFLGKPKHANLHIAVNAKVERLIIDEETKRATHVIATVNGKPVKLSATNEIIVSAGVINSPNLLLNSGIGPKDELEKHDIKMYVDLPVGKNFRDHVSYMAFIKFKDPVLEAQPDTTLDNLYQYYLNQKGPLGGIGTFNLMGLINTENKSAEYPDAIMFHGIIKKGDPSLAYMLHFTGYNEEYSKQLMEVNKDYHIIEFFSQLLKPKSVGEVKYGPKVHPNYVTEEEDFLALMRLKDYFYDYTQTDTMKSRQAELVELDTPCKVNGVMDWKCYMKYNTGPGWHGVGTCKMGKKEHGGVVDNKLKIYGLENVRVCDASIMPTVPSANTHAPSVMVGERCAEFIKNDNK